MKKLAFFLIGGCLSFAAFAEPVEVELPETKVLGNTSGRYVFGQISSYRRDQYLLDTATGRLWQKVVDKNDNEIMQPVPFIQLYGERAYVPEPLEHDEEYRATLRAKTFKKSE